MLSPDSTIKAMFNALHSARQRGSEGIYSTIELHARLGKRMMRGDEALKEDDAAIAGEQLANFVLGDISLWRLVQQIKRTLPDHDRYPQLAYFVEEVDKHSRTHSNASAQLSIGTAWRNLLNDTPYVCAKVKTRLSPSGTDIQVPRYTTESGEIDTQAIESHLKKTCPYMIEYQISMPKGRPMTPEMTDRVPLPIMERLLYRSRSHIWGPINHRD